MYFSSRVEKSYSFRDRYLKEYTIYSTNTNRGFKFDRFVTLFQLLSVYNQTSTYSKQSYNSYPEIFILGSIL